MSTPVLRKLLWHAKQLFRITSNSDFPTTFRRGSMTGEGVKATSQPGVKQSGDSSLKLWQMTPEDRHRKKVDDRIEIFGPEVMVQVYANNMLAGPCDSCIALAKRPVPISLAPSGPLPDCPHPDQCALWWRSIYNPD